MRLRVEFYDLATLMLLALLIWGEARGESTTGKIAVALVVRNRVNAQKKYFGDGYPEVILKKNQFSYFNNKGLWRLLSEMRKIRDEGDECVEVASAVLKEGAVEDITNGATYYVNYKLKGKMSWMKDLVYIRDIGDHSFYREKDVKE